MARSRSADDIVKIEREIAQLMQDLETRVGRLNTLTKRTAANAANGAAHAASDASDFVSDTLNDTLERLKNGANGVGDEAAKFGNEALKRIEDEVEQRPLLTLAIAAGIGFLAGVAGRRH